MIVVALPARPRRASTSRSTASRTTSCRRAVVSSSTRSQPLAEATAGPDLSASYGAQGAEILLDAIARSDGTRASVLEEIRRTRIENGILGDIAFNPQGDLVEAPFTYYRVRGERFVPDRVVVVRTSRPGGP